MSANVNSLVGYGLSSDSESDGEGDDGNSREISEDGVRDGRSGEVEERKCRNFLLESGSSESESEQEDQVEPETPTAELTPRVIATKPSTPTHTRPLSHKLPPPPLGASGLWSGEAVSSSSVFANPYRERAEEQLNMLQKHVPLTLEPRPSQIGGRKICIAYRRDGRCRFGSSCKFAHDSDLQTFTPTTDNQGPITDRESGNGNHRGNLATSHVAPECHQNSHFLSQPCVDQELDLEGDQGRKRRVGLSDTLVPPKRAMNQYTLQRERERMTPS
ncbi:hypothetical protein AGOR_G00192080 [Albula goreensis]|uniref:C3H1-type domain-containing protein n=1 Tax=Albula goreensis TaxID=1534307 RepID=A0A8T3CQW6_9TELE|nr:hypothetical protein AGOR_G00192080 [Albula goreensis]